MYPRHAGRSCRIARSGEAPIRGLRVDPSAGLPISELPLESIPSDQNFLPPSSPPQVFPELWKLPSRESSQHSL